VGGWLSTGLSAGFRNKFLKKSNILILSDFWFARRYLVIPFG
jgi:hypothetical protein